MNIELWKLVIVLGVCLGGYESVVANEINLRKEPVPLEILQVAPGMGLDDSDIWSDRVVVDMDRPVDVELKMTIKKGGEENVVLWTGVQRLKGGVELTVFEIPAALLRDSDYEYGDWRHRMIYFRTSAEERYLMEFEEDPRVGLGRTDEKTETRRPTGGTIGRPFEITWRREIVANTMNRIKMPGRHVLRIEGDDLFQILNDAEDWNKAWGELIDGRLIEMMIEIPE